MKAKSFFHDKKSMLSCFVWLDIKHKLVKVKLSYSDKAEGVLEIVLVFGIITNFRGWMFGISSNRKLQRQFLKTDQ